MFEIGYLQDSCSKQLQIFIIFLSHIGAFHLVGFYSPAFSELLQLTIYYAQ